MVVVHLLDDAGAEQAGHARTHPVAAGVGVASGQVYAGEVFPPQVAVRVQDHGIDVHAVGAAAGLDEVGGELVAEAARAEVNADPDAVQLVGEQVDEVVAGADRAELGARQVAERGRLRDVPGRVVVEQLVIDRLRVLAADAERQGAP